MTYFLIFIEVVLVILLVILSSIAIDRPNISAFELKRRAKDDEVLLTLKNYQLFNSIISFVYVLTIISLTVLTLQLKPGLNGYLLTLALVYIAYLISSIKYIKETLASLFQPVQKRIMVFIDSKHKLINYFVFAKKESSTPRISSSEELENVISTDKDILSAEQKRLVLNGLKFYQKTAKQVMIKRSDIMTVKGSEVMGPLTLDKLYKSKQDFALVIGKNIDEVKGVLSLQELLTVEADSDTTKTAIKMAKTPPYYISQELTLGESLDEMLENKTDTLIVTDKNQNTTGLITIEILLGALVK